MLALLLKVGLAGMGLSEYLTSLEVERLQAASQLVRESQSWSWVEGKANLRFDLPPHGLAVLILDFEPQV